MEVFVVTDKYMPYKACILIPCGMRTLAVFNNVEEASAYAEAHVRRLEHLLYHIDMYDNESSLNGGSRPHGPRADGTLMWQLNSGHEWIVNIEKSHVHTIASLAPPKEPTVVYDEHMEVNLKANMDTKANYEREMAMKIEADEDLRQLVLMMRVDPHEYERLRRTKFEADDEERRRVVLKKEPVEENNTAIKAEADPEDEKKPYIKSEPVLSSKSDAPPSSSEWEGLSKPRIKVEEES